MTALATWRRDKGTSVSAEQRASAAAAFPDPVTAHVHMLGVGVVAVVGAVRPEARAALGDRGVAELLVRADIVRIWAHIEGTAHLVRETSEEGRYTASFIGSHLYFTNVCNEAHFAFDLAIAPDGAITVTGR